MWACQCCPGKSLLFLRELSILGAVCHYHALFLFTVIMDVSLFLFSHWQFVVLNC